MKNRSIKLDEKYSVDTSDGTATLIFAEKRSRKKIDKETKKPTGEIEEYLYTETYYRPTIHSALRLYLDKCLEPAKDVKSCVELIETTYEKINNLKWKEQ